LTAASTPPDLTVVMPAYDEAEGIAALVRAWADALDALGIVYELRVYDDGSTDSTAVELDRIAGEIPALRAASHANRGHGPTVLRGYREARGRWVFQVDGDGEIAPRHFAALWDRRDEADLVLGRRTGRQDGFARAIVSGVARLSVRCLFGGRIHDVNSPFRLFRRDALERLLPEVPEGTFAPNVLLTGLACRHGLRVLEVPVPNEGRRWGRASLASWRLWRKAAIALRQTASLALGRRRAS
jgi:glycosyltransferase involved in cell wall biosynthesis